MQTDISDTQNIQDTQRFLRESLISVHARIAAACTRAHRNPSGVTLVAVSKKQPVERVQAFLDLCVSQNIVPVLGENYIQEFKKKRAILTGAFKAHALGPLQSNKVKDAVALFDCIESVHSFEILEAINTQASRRGKVQEVLLQVNISKDGEKSGFTVDEVRSLVSKELPQAKAIKCCGLMTITKAYENPADARPDFQALGKLREELVAIGGPATAAMVELSMGMSADFEVAIEEGATIVRVGTALFGEREYTSK
jgi:pyridoxal phosphate enzyme (YggS family)